MQFNTSVLFSANLRSCTVFIDNSCVYQISASGCEIPRCNLESENIHRSVLYYILQYYNLLTRALESSLSAIIETIFQRLVRYAPCDCCHRVHNAKLLSIHIN